MALQCQMQSCGAVGPLERCTNKPKDSMAWAQPFPPGWTPIRKDIRDGNNLQGISDGSLNIICAL